MKKYLQLLIGFLIPTFTFMIINVFAQDKRDAFLLPDTSLNPLTVDQMNPEPPKCIVIGVDCKEGEFLAILKNQSQIKNPGYIQFATLDDLDRLSNNKLGIKFTYLNAYRLSDLSAKDNTGALINSNVCGNYLLRIRFEPENKVNEAMNLFRNFLFQASPSALLNKATIFGIQPEGFGKPPTSEETSEEKPNGKIEDATVRIKSHNLDTSNLPDVSVAVLDTGWTSNIMNSQSKLSNVTINKENAFDMTNLDIQPLPNAIGDTFSVSNGSFQDFMGHGTPITHIIGSLDKTIGVAANARITPIKICSGVGENSGECLESSTIYATCYAMSKDINASVINMSFAGRIMPPDGAGYHAPIFQGLIRDAERNGALIVAAAGNSRDTTYIEQHPMPEDMVRPSNGDPLFPSIFSSGYKSKLGISKPTQEGMGLLSVGATFTTKEYARFATYNNHVDISAPGSWVKVIGTDGQIKDNLSTPPANASGTSFSAAYVSGAAALLIARGASLDPPKQMTAAQLARLIVKSANPKGCIKTIPNSEECGSGLLDVEAAWLNLAKPGNP